MSIVNYKKKSRLPGDILEAGDLAIVRERNGYERYHVCRIWKKTRVSLWVEMQSSGISARFEPNGSYANRSPMLPFFNLEVYDPEKHEKQMFPAADLRNLTAWYKKALKRFEADKPAEEKT